MFTIVAAIGINNELGKGNKLIWHIKEDLRFFKILTLYGKVLMGRKTFESLPNGALENRKNFVVSNNPNLEIEGVSIISDLPQFIKENETTEDEIFVIGGGTIYNTMLPYCEKIILTRIEDKCKDSDTFFPEFDEDMYTKELMCECTEGNISYKRFRYIRK